MKKVDNVVNQAGQAGREKTVERIGGPLQISGDKADLSCFSPTSAPEEYGENREIRSETNGTAACDQNQALRRREKHRRTNSY